jgi:hypothetical protein
MKLVVTLCLLGVSVVSVEAQQMTVVKPKESDAG